MSRRIKAREWEQARGEQQVQRFREAINRPARTLPKGFRVKVYRDPTTGRLMCEVRVGDTIVAVVAAEPAVEDEILARWLGSSLRCIPVDDQLVFEEPLTDAGPDSGRLARERLSLAVQRRLPDQYVASYDRYSGDRVERVVVVASPDLAVAQDQLAKQQRLGQVPGDLAFEYVPGPSSPVYVPFDRPVLSDG
jgi:hypothetical protein